MSYCRFSSDNWMCDIYAWEDVGGYWAIAVAERRRVRGPKPVVDFSKDEWIADHQANMKDLETIPFVDITLPHAGEFFAEPTLDAFEARLRELRDVGYRFPDAVFDVIAEERANGT